MIDGFPSGHTDMALLEFTVSVCRMRTPHVYKGIQQYYGRSTENYFEIDCHKDIDHWCHSKSIPVKEPRSHNSLLRLLRSSADHNFPPPPCQRLAQLWELVSSSTCLLPTHSCVPGLKFQVACVKEVLNSQCRHVVHVEFKQCIGLMLAPCTGVNARQTYQCFNDFCKLKCKPLCLSLKIKIFACNVLSPNNRIVLPYKNQNMRMTKKPTMRWAEFYCLMGAKCKN